MVRSIVRTFHDNYYRSRSVVVAIIDIYWQTILIRARGAAIIATVTVTV